MNKLFRITAIILLILGSVVPVSAQRFHTSLPKYFEIEDANEWCSQQLTFEKAIEGIRITVFGTNTPDNIDYNSSLPIVGIAEIDIMDNDGNDITYSATANSVNGYVGNGLAGLNDNDIDKGYYQSAQEGPGNYVYIELTFDKPQSAFTFKMQRCSSGDNFPLQFTLSHLGNEAKPPFNPSIPSEPGGSQDDVAGLSYSLIYKVDGEVYKTETVEYGAAITLIDEPTKEGHTFSGWSEAPETMPAKDIVIEGSFTVNSYTITYIVDGEVYKTETVAYGAAITLIDEPTKEGHTFSGWSEAPETMPAKDIVIEGSFTVNSYTITYKVDGEVYKTETVAYGAAITLIDEPTKEGHTFSGWSEAPETMPANDIIIEGTFNVNSYTITYKVDGEVYKTEAVAYGSVITLIDEPTKEGHTFSGWSEAPETMPAKDIVIEGSFTVNSYTITYKVDGEVYKTETVEYGSKISLPEHPVKEGYTFSGWKNVPETMPANDIEITGSFVTNGYTVTYMVDGNEYASYVVEYGAPLTLPAEPIKEGHSFVEWEGLPDTMPAKDITVNAKFRVNSYKVTYVVNGNEYASYDVEYGAGIPTPENPVKEGHTFSGWSEAPETMPAKDIVIEGSFTVNSYTITYIVDGEVYKTETVAYGSAITLIDEPTKEGYTFSGWSEAPETMPANDIIIEGIFNVNSYTITYKVDGEVYKTEAVAYGAAITLIDEPTKEGHTFSGWSEAPETMPAKDVVIEGTFSVNSYTITYKVDGEVYKTETVAYGTAITLIDEPTKEGHTFSGWSEAPETMPAKDIVIEGSFTVNSYTVTYMVDGEIYKTETVEYGSKISLPEHPVKEGYTFSGWKNVPETMPAFDIEITGSFVTNGYTVTYMVDGNEYASYVVEYGAPLTLPAEPTKEGHTFSGWSEAPETMPAKDIVIEGSFTVNSYTITYKVDGEVYKTEAVAYGSAITLIDEPTKEGHTFSGWSEAPETMPAKDIVIEGGFTVNSYTITYKVDGEVYKTEAVAYGSAITLIDEPTKEGHTFSGWSEAPETMPAKDIVIEGTFSVNSYKVTYVVNGNEYASYDVEYGAGIPAPENPTKEGHTFSGWSEAPETMPAKDIVIEGSFTVNSYTITYKVDGEVYKTEAVAYGSAITLIDEPTKEGHTFSGWSEAPETMPAKDIIIEGSFTVNSYTITYKVDGEVYKTETVEYGAAITLIDEPTKEGYTFSGWSEAPETMPAKDIVIEGSFTINSYTITYIVDSEVYKTETVEYGSKISLPENPVKEGHTFSGWSKAPETMPAKDITIEGSFTVNSYTITYKVDGEVYKTEAVAYGSAITLIDEPTKEGHTFSGWSEAPETMPAKDIVIEGSFTVNSYTITYKVDGEVYKTEAVAYGSVITLIDEPTKEGHTFSGWSEAPETMPAKDIVIEGSFTVNSYTITYKVDGEIYKTEAVAYGSVITLIDEPTKEGHTFSGWSEAPETMPAKDIVIEGSFTVNSYTITYKVDGEIYKTEAVAYGSVITLIDEPTKEGHTFSGWSEAPETMPAKDIVIEGSFTVNSYTITYKVDGEVYATYTVEYGAVVPVPENPVKEGYIFEGWTSIPDTMPAEDVVIEAVFSADTGINGIDYDRPQDVYSLGGVLIKHNATAEDIILLPQGTYIIGGKKVYIRR